MMLSKLIAQRPIPLSLPAGKRNYFIRGAAAPLKHPCAGITSFFSKHSLISNSIEL